MSRPKQALPTAADQAEGRGSVLERVVVGYDGSDGANAAAAFGVWLAGKLGSELTVVHAAPTPEHAPSGDQLRAAADQVVASEREWRWRMEQVRDQAPQDAPIDCRVVRGSPAGALLAAATETNADLILTGSHGVGRVRAAVLGSVSSQVLYHAPCSVMVFHQDDVSTLAADARTVVVGVDSPASSRHAIELGQRLAVALGAALTLVHAYDPHVPFVSQPTEALREEVRGYARAVLCEARDMVDALDVDEELVEGHAPHALVDVCERCAPALLVVGSRGLGGFKELLLGSTSRAVANAAPCPVLVARDPGPRE